MSTYVNQSSSLGKIAKWPILACHHLASGKKFDVAMAAKENHHVEEVNHLSTGHFP